MPSALKTQLLNAGFRDVRLYVDPAAFSTASDATILTMLSSGPFVAISDLLASGFHRVIFDFHWQPGPSVTPGWGATDVINNVANGNTKFNRMVHIATIVAPALVSTYGDQVIFGLFNEWPPVAQFTGVTQAVQQASYYDSVRAVAPTLKVTVTDSDQGDIGTYLTLPFDFSHYATDPNTYFEAHDYTPAAFTPQGGIGGQGANASYAQYLTVPFPPFSEGDTLSSAEAASAALINADTSTSSGQKTSFISSVNAFLAPYYNTPQNVAWLQARFTAWVSLADSNVPPIPHYRFILGEHGCVGVATADNPRSYISPSGGGGADLASRINYYAAVSLQARTLGISISTHTLEADPYEITDGTQNLIPALTPAMYP